MKVAIFISKVIIIIATVMLFSCDSDDSDESSSQPQEEAPQAAQISQEQALTNEINNSNYEFQKTINDINSGKGADLDGPMSSLDSQRIEYYEKNKDNPNQMEKCPICDGTEECQVCGGTGNMYLKYGSCEICTRCNGTGKCRFCGGTGCIHR